ncbi:hypothetical protein LDX98_15535, partial [Acinetobacter baumannii]|nr:hypothetical protein [Acinetobacter baumannii]
ALSLISGVYFNLVIGTFSQNTESPTNPVRFIGVREHLFFSKSIRNDLLDLAIQAGGYGLVIQYIRKMMNDNPQGTENSSPNFENQAKDLLNKGLISKKGFDALIA